MPFSAEHLKQILSRSSQSVTRLWVAYSGGIDSHVLLHRLQSMREDLPDIAGAIHIHHDLSPNADHWAEHCRQVCQAMGLHCQITHVQVADGEGLEDSARRARYAAFEGVLQAGDALLLAQHQDDQAETFLLQALRGGGPKGLAGMPELSVLGKGHVVRPMLGISRSQIHDYAEQHGLQWIEDESNQDMRFDRNYIRHQVMPLLLERWPAAGRTLARTAAHSAGLVKIADELLQDELQGVMGSRANTLSIQALQSVPQERAALLIRALCYQLQLPLPSTSHVQELMGKQIHASDYRQIHINWPGAEFRRYRDDLYILAPRPEPVQIGWQYAWDGHDELIIPELEGRLSVHPAPEGVRQSIIDKGLNVRPRTGGERCQPAGDNHRRELKAIYQDHAIPPWEREQLPLIYAEDELIAIADIVISQHAVATAGEPAFQFVWQSIH